MPHLDRPAIILSLASLAALAACRNERREEFPNEVAANAAEAEPAAAVPAQSAQLIDANGRRVGAVELSEDVTGVTLKVTAAGLPAGAHGVHLHEVGKCEPPKFESAGAHWNPEHKQHGRDNPQGAHLGDLDNWTLGAGETATSYVIGSVTLNRGPNALADADGTSLVIHARQDDYKTDPSGNSGDRIACAVLAAPK
jgi:Cu-Zn family superoxide dismutase